MAIDTARKRASVAGVGKIWRGRAIIPDGTIDQGDRQQIAWSYSGILAGAVTAILRTVTLPARVFTLNLSERELELELPERSFTLRVRSQ